MKHLKSYEASEEYTYHKGDYVRIDYLYNEYDVKILYKTPAQFKMLFKNGKTKFIPYHLIMRKLTDDEIKQFELESEANKYNL